MDQCAHFLLILYHNDYKVAFKANGVKYNLIQNMVHAINKEPMKYQRMCSVMKHEIWAELFYDEQKWGQNAYVHSTLYKKRILFVST